MDKQFARILMLSVLLPAGAALAEAIQHEHVTFTALDRSVMSELAGTPHTALARKPTSDVRQVATTADAHDQRTQHAAPRGAATSGGEF